MTTPKKGEPTWIKWRCAWAQSPKLGKLKRLGIESPAMYLLRAWTWAIEEHKGPDIDTDELEESVFWDGDDGALVAAFTRVGFLKGNRFDLWWEEGPGTLLATREKDKKRKQNERDNAQKASTGKPESSDGGNESSEGPSPVSHEKSVTSRERLSEVRSVDLSQREREGPETTTDAHRLPAASNTPIRQAFMDEYERRTNGSPLSGGKWNKGFFGSNGSFDVAEYLDKVAQGYPRVVRIALPSFWPAWDQSQPRHRRGHYPDDLKGELEKYLMSRGLPNPMVRMNAGKL